MALDPALLDRLVDRRCVVVELDAERRRARIELARLVLQVRQLDERMVLAQRDRRGDRRRLADERPGSSSVVKVSVVSTSVFLGNPFVRGR